jgi:hypothetical protein
MVDLKSRRPGNRRRLFFVSSAPHRIPLSELCQNNMEPLAWPDFHLVYAGVLIYLIVKRAAISVVSTAGRKISISSSSIPA